MSQPYKYFAFISYSRDDSKAAAWLQKSLEWFRFPVKLVPKDRRPPHPTHIRRIFRDKTDLKATDEHYWINIRRALEESRFLIILCSPSSAHPRQGRSDHPVNMEVEHFLATHDNNSSFLAPVILGGNVTSEGTDAALCPALRAVRDYDGKPLIDRNLPTMVPDATNTEQDAWEAGFVSLVSYILSLDRTAIGDHIQRETKRQARVLRRWIVAVATLAIAALFAGGIAWRMWHSAEERRIAADEARMFAEKARNDADGLIRFMGRDLFSKLEEFGRLDLLTDVAQKTEIYLRENPAGPDDLNIHLSHIQSLLNSAQIYREAGKMADSETSANDAFEIMEQLVRNHADNRNLVANVIQQRVNGVKFFQNYGRPFEGIEVAEATIKLVDIWEKKHNQGFDLKTKASAYNQLGQSYLALDRNEDALKAFNQEVSLRRSDLDQASPTDQAREKNGLISALLTQGEALYGLNRYEAALKVKLEGLDLSRQRLAEEPTNSLLLRTTAQCAMNAARIAVQTDKSSIADSLFVEGKQLAEKLHQTDPSRHDWAMLRGTCFMELASHLAETGRAAEAVKLLSPITLEMEQLSAQHPKDAIWQGQPIAAWLTLARAHAALGSPKEAFTAAASMIRLRREQIKANPANSSLPLELAEELVIGSSFSNKAGDWEAAIDLTREALEIVDRPGLAKEGVLPRIRDIRNNAQRRLCDHLVAAKRFEEAFSFGKLALIDSTKEAIASPEADDKLQLMGNALISALTACKLEAEYDDLLNSCLSIVSNALTSTAKAQQTSFYWERLERICIKLGSAYLNRQLYNGALLAFRQQLEIATHRLALDKSIGHQWAGAAHANISVVLSRMKQPQQGVAEAVQAAFHRGEHAKLNLTDILAQKNASSAWISAAFAHAKLGEVEKVMDECKKALSYTPDDSEILGGAARCAAIVRKDSDAVQWIEKAIKLTPDDPNIHYLAGWTFLRLDNSDLALRHFERAVHSSNSNKPLAGTRPQWLHIGQACIYAQRGETELALAAYRALLADDDNWRLAETIASDDLLNTSEKAMLESIRAQVVPK